ncbi:MAG: hypothetical protein ACOYN2_01490 [Patescibacteria group bacterium]
MSPTSKKNVLLASLHELISVWDFAMELEQLVMQDNLSEDEMNELFLIISDAVRHVHHQEKTTELLNIKHKINKMLHEEQLQRVKEHKEIHSIFHTH